MVLRLLVKKTHSLNYPKEVSLKKMFRVFLSFQAAYHFHKKFIFQQNYSLLCFQYVGYTSSINLQLSIAYFAHYFSASQLI